MKSARRNSEKPKLDRPRRTSSALSAPHETESFGLRPDAVMHEVPDRRIYTAAMGYFFSVFTRRRDAIAGDDS